MSATVHLGTLCRRGHAAPGAPGKSLRYSKSGNRCVICHEEARQRYINKHRDVINERLRTRLRTDEVYADKVRARDRQRGYGPKRAGVEKWRRWQREYKRRTRLENRPSVVVDRLRCRLRTAVILFGDGARRPAVEYGIDWFAIVEKLGPCPGPREAWEIDHIKPCCSYDHADPQQVAECWHPDNLRWIPKAENRRKAKDDRKLSIHK